MEIRKYMTVAMCTKKWLVVYYLKVIYKKQTLNQRCMYVYEEGNSLIVKWGFAFYEDKI